MIAGLPGTGIGGVFYLISALLMPLREFSKVLRGRSSLKRWRFVFLQMTLALGVIAGFWVTGLLLTLMLHKVTVTDAHGTHAISSVIHYKPIVSSFGVMLGVLFLIEILNLFSTCGKKHRSR